MKNEFEATFLSIDKDQIRSVLKEAGFTLEIPEYKMQRKTFDFSRVAPGQNKWARVRKEFDKTTMTVKEVRGSGISDTYEIEVTVNDFDAAVAFLEACSIPAKAFQENLREVWRRDDIEVTIDTWPGLAPFVEVEAPTEDLVRKVSGELGFNYDTAVFGSVDVIYEKELGVPAKEIIAMPEISFAQPPKSGNAA